MNKYRFNIYIAGIFTIATLISNFLLYRVSNGYLNDETLYGIWLIVLSIITWFYILDFGISNSLRNMLTEYIERKEEKKIKQVIYTTYICLLLPLAFMVIIGLLINSWVDWASVFNVNQKGEDIKKVMYITFIMFPFIFYLNTITYIYHAYFKSYIVNIMQFLNLFLNVIVIGVMSISGSGNIVKMCMVYFSINISVYLIFTVAFFFNKRLSFLHPANLNKKMIAPLLSVGLAFLLLDIASIILYNSGPILISYFFNPKESVGFQISYKLFNVYLTLSTIVLSPLWTLIIKLYVKRDKKSIYDTTKKVSIIIGGLILAIIVTSFFANKIMTFWIGREFNLNNLYILLMAIIVILTIISHFFKVMLNGMSKIYYEVIVYTAAIIISLALMFILIRIYDYGIYAFISSILIGVAIPAILFPVKFFYEVNKISER